MSFFTYFGTVLQRGECYQLDVVGRDVATGESALVAFDIDGDAIYFAPHGGSGRVRVTVEFDGCHVQAFARDRCYVFTVDGYGSELIRFAVKS